MIVIKSIADVFIGRDASLEVAKILSNNCYRKILIIVDSNVAGHPGVERLMREYECEALSLSISSEPTYNYLDDVVDSCRRKDYDCIFGIGGGSVLDTAKAVGILLANPGRGIEYRGMDKVKNRGVDVCLFPTTAGTGSEATRTASFIDSNEKTKMGINGRHVECTAAFLDPEFTVEAPWSVTLSAGLDVLVHAVEAVSAKNTMHYSAMLGAQAAAMAMDSLKKIKDDPKNLAWREKQLLASYYAGVAMFHSQGGIASAISYPLGVHFNVPHGIAGGIFMPHEIAFNVEKGFTGYAICADVLGIGYGKSDKEKACLFADEYMRFHNEVASGLTLKDYGATERDLELLTMLTMEQRKGCLELNPINAGQEDVEWFLNKAFGR